jgi:hypothetical protein
LFRSWDWPAKVVSPAAARGSPAWLDTSVAFAPTEVCPPTVRFISWRIDEGTVCMIVIGADTHKSSHAFAAVNAATGRLVGSRTVAADEAGQLAALNGLGG